MSKRSHRLIAFAFLLFLGHLWLIPASFAQDDVDEEVKNKCKQFREFAKFIQGKAASKSVVESDKKANTTSTSLSTFKQNKTCVLIVFKTQRDGKGISEVAYGINSKYEFEMVNTRQEIWVLRKLVAGDPVKAKDSDWNLRDHVFDSLTLAHARELLEKTCKVTKTQPKTVNRMELVLLDYERSPTKDLPYESKGRMTFNRTMGLALMKVEAVSKYKNDVTTSTVDYEYAGKLKDFAKLTRTTMNSSTRVADGSTRKSTTVTEYDLRYDEKVPDVDFMLSAFGLPEPMGVPK